MLHIVSNFGGRREAAVIGRIFLHPGPPAVQDDPIPPNLVGPDLRAPRTKWLFVDLSTAI